MIVVKGNGEYYQAQQSLKNFVKIILSYLQVSRRRVISKGNQYGIIDRQNMKRIYGKYFTHTSFIDKLNRGRQSASRKWGKYFKLERCITDSIKYKQCQLLWTRLLIAIMAL